MSAFLSSVRAKIYVTVTIIFLAVISIVTVYSTIKERDRTLNMAEQHVQSMVNFYFDSLNTMMLTNTMKQRSILRQKILKQPGIVEARVVRGQPVIAQYGEGNADEIVVDDLDARALQGEKIEQIKSTPEGRILTMIIPFRASMSSGDVNCLSCHKVQENAVNGAIRISFSLAEMDEELVQQTQLTVTANIVLVLIGLFLINVFMRKWITSPLSNLMEVVNKRADGDTQIRAKVEDKSEIGSLAQSFNTMADNVNHVTECNKAAAEDLVQKIDHLLDVVNQASKGDLTGQVTFTSNDGIGALGNGVQIMIDNLRKLMEEKRQAVRSLQEKVDVILETVSNAAKGDLTGKIDIEGDDAIGQLAAGVQEMINNINALIAQVQRSGIQVTSSGMEIAATAKQQEITVTKQAATTNEIVATATEISATSKELLSTMDEVSNLADSTASAAESGHAGLARMEETIRLIVTASGVIASKLEVLNEKAANINTVVTTITKVADQTNLLSLNAAIEAEKAGEYGLGFSVVATEIRRLADQTAIATWDIEQMVKEMQTAVTAGVMSVDKFSKDVQDSVQEVSQVGAELNQIIGQVQSLTPRFETVHEGMQFQSQGADQIKQAIVHLSETARQTVDSLQKSNSAIETLNEAANGLQTGVSRFKVLSN
ncbi:MAG: methyl-accepting chemotaxis protein [Candidatus Polarisedimenticolaceae bacterium]|nr:methyl-accepting chemotaxis protein [Candidatus Polarisedimenticolaceae bacterium]